MNRREEKDQIKLLDFPGVAIDTDPHDRSPGVAAVQVNVTSANRGKLQTRKGYHFADFEDD